MRLFERIKRKTSAFRDDTEGSEAIEMVTTVAMLVVFIMIGIMFLTYVVNLNLVNTATKQVVRSIEVTGVANQMQMRDRFNEFLGSNPQLTDRRVELKNASPGNIQLKQTFQVVGSCTYRVPLINPGSFDGYTITLPIKTTVAGMSEVYHKS